MLFLLYVVYGIHVLILFVHVCDGEIKSLWRKMKLAINYFLGQKQFQQRICIGIIYFHELIVPIL